MCSCSGSILFSATRQKWTKQSMTWQMTWYQKYTSMLHSNEVLQWNEFSRYIPIATIIFRLDLFLKTVHHELLITTMTQYILRQTLELECLLVLFVTVIGTYNAHMWQITWYILYFWILELMTKLWKECLHERTLFSFVIFFICTCCWNCEKKEFFLHMDIFHIHYSVIGFFSHGKLLWETCLCHNCLIINRLWQYLEIFHNTVKQISSEADNFYNIEREPFFPWPCWMIFCGYENHVAS